MPTVGRYTKVIEEAPLPGAPALLRPVSVPQSLEPAEGFQQAGQQISGLSAEMKKSADIMQDRKNKSMASETFVQFGDQIRAKQLEYLDTSKGDAMGVTVDAEKSIDELIESASASLENDEQKMMFTSLVNPRRRSYLDSIASHEAGELNRWEAESLKAIAEDSMQYAIENHSVPGAVEDSIRNIDTAVTTAMEGSSSVSIEREKKRQLTTMHSEVIGKIAVNDTGNAREYYNKYKNQIDGTAQKSIESLLKNAGTKQKAQEETDRITINVEGNADQLEAARKIDNPDVREYTVQLVKIRQQEEKRFEAESRQAFIDDAASRIMDAPSLEAAFYISDTAQYGTDQKKLRDLARSEFMRAEKDIKTNPAKMLEARQRIDNGEIGSPTQLLLEYKPYASNTDWKTLDSYYREGGIVGEIKDSTVRSIYKNVTGGKDPNDHDEEYQRVWDFVARNLPRDKFPTDEVVRGLITQSFTEGENEDNIGWFDENMTYMEAQERGLGKTWMPTVKGEERKRIKRVLESQGKKADDFWIKFYKKHVIMGRPYVE